ncbi:hypothetical protein [Bacillus massilinigeriensis]|uniref:hypothetical protein n=1 Tax=Bacillus massilionigeriensis TaxID=1805475 RepID=UPI00096AF079|nr:hypothetical protein [Bacillus massilionigeriensis]
MKVFLYLIIGVFVVFSLTGCIGENYDFSPPAINLSSNSNLKSEELEEANIDWRGEGNNPIEKETEDILALAKKQQPMYFITGEKVDLLSEHADFKTEGLSVSVWQNEKKLDLEVNNISFYLPKEKGEYVIEVNLQTDRGNAQYVGNLVIVE